jgi:hypothetical protein
MAKNAGRDGAVRRAARPTPTGDENLHSGGTRETSRHGGPQREPSEGDEDAGVRMNSDEDTRSRSTPGRRDPEERKGGEEKARDTKPRGALPAGTVREDYVGGERAHKTREKGGTRGASGRRNEVI